MSFVVNFDSTAASYVESLTGKSEKDHLRVRLKRISYGWNRKGSPAGKLLWKRITAAESSRRLKVLPNENKQGS
jgi:hypothetical protein